MEWDRHAIWESIIGKVGKISNFARNAKPV